MTRFIYDSGSVSTEILPDGNVYKYYRADGIIGSIDSTGSKLYYSQNTHGDVTTIYDVTGIVLKDYRYSAYGKPQTIRYNGINQPYLIQWYAETNTVHNPFGYCGEYTDRETGFVYLRNRYYDPSTGRFVQEDPVRDGLNWYIYCSNNPISFIDPFGLSGEPTDTEVYLRAMFNMYKKNKKDKIAVYNNRVEVTLNNKQETYYYDTSDRRQADGNRMNGDKMIVDAVSFAKKFNLVKNRKNSGDEFFYFTYWDASKITLTTNASWRMDISYVETPKKKIVFYQSLTIIAKGWASPEYEISRPTITMAKNITFTQEEKSTNVSLKPGESLDYPGTYYNVNRYSNAKTIFDREPVTASAFFSLSSKGALYSMYTKNIKINF